MSPTCADDRGHDSGWIVTLWTEDVALDYCRAVDRAGRMLAHGPIAARRSRGPSAGSAGSGPRRSRWSACMDYLQPRSRDRWGSPRRDAGVGRGGEHLRTQRTTSLTEMGARMAVRVHTRLGPGMLASAYERCLSDEFDRNEIPYAAGLIYHSPTTGSGWSAATAPT